MCLCNLPSISQLTKDKNHTILFSGSTCILQDLDLKKVIEIGSVVEGLYKHNAKILLSACHVSTSIQLNYDILD